jgi:type IX secretion system PorP/SprF family membrane protein
MRSGRILVSCIAAMMIVSGAHAQYFQFSQYTFTQQRVNPAMLGTFHYTAISFDYRRQSTNEGFNLNSNYIHASMPLVGKSGSRRSAMGVEFLDDRSIGRSVFQAQSLAVSYAYNFQMPRNQILSIGTKILYQSKKLNLDELAEHVDDIPDRGLDESVVDDASSSELKATYISFNLSAYWQRTDKKGNRLLYAGLSFFDFNKPSDASRGVENNLSGTTVGMVGIRAFKKGKISIVPEVLATLHLNTAVFNLGWVTQYELYPSTRLDFLTKYVTERAVVAGIQLHRQTFSLGFSYDWQAGSKMPSNTNAFEVGLEIRKLVKPKRKKKTKAPVEKTVIKEVPKAKEVIAVDTLQTEAVPVVDTVENMSTRLKHKQDSIMALASAGALQHEAFVLERATLHFNFEFNSAKLDGPSKKYLDELAQALIENPHLNIKLTGHTDNIGSDKFNMKLSISRAEAIKNFIVDRGVAAERILAEGKGLREPLNENKTEEGRNKNRRVELTILFED